MKTMPKTMTCVVLVEISSRGLARDAQRIEARVLLADRVELDLAAVEQGAVGQVGAIRPSRRDEAGGAIALPVRRGRVQGIHARFEAGIARDERPELAEVDGLLAQPGRVGIEELPVTGEREAAHPGLLVDQRREDVACGERGRIDPVQGRALGRRPGD